MVRLQVISEASQHSQHYDDRAYSPRSQQYNDMGKQDGGTILPLLARDKMSRVGSGPTYEELSNKYDQRGTPTSILSDKRSAKEVEHDN